MMMGKVTITPIASSLEMKNIDTMLPHACVRLRSPCEITCLNELLNAAVSDDSRSMISPVWCVSKKARSWQMTVDAKVAVAKRVVLLLVRGRRSGWCCCWFEGGK
jgi:hypothetical protein